MLDDRALTAISVVFDQSHGRPIDPKFSVTLNFHPDTLYSGATLLSQLAHDGVYRSQFETGISAGAVSAHPGGSRWNWESKLFNGAYDDAPAEQRPKYGALNHTKNSIGAAPRFGSAHFHLKAHALRRCTFAYPDSHLNPKNFATSERMSLVSLVTLNEMALDVLDNYIEAHVHGPLQIDRDVDALVLDPSYKYTDIEDTANLLPCKVEWHKGFYLSSDYYAQCCEYRGKAVAEFIKLLASKEPVTPAVLGKYRNSTVDPQILKQAWHCLARFGYAWP